MTYLGVNRLKQILIIAPELLGETLSIQLTNTNFKAVLRKEQLTQPPSLVIWCIDNSEFPQSIGIELTRLKERWEPAPILLLLPDAIRLSTQELLKLNCAGLLQDPSINTLNKSISTLLEGGRVVRLKDSSANVTTSQKAAIGLGQWLLISGLQQIDDDLELIDLLLETHSSNFLSTVIILGRRRELNSARAFLNFLWGPSRISIIPLKQIKTVSNQTPQKKYGIEIDLTQKNPIAVWQELYSRIEKSIKGEIINSTENILALEVIKPSYKKELLSVLLKQLDNVIEKLRNLKGENTNLNQYWTDLQTELRQQSLRALIGNYIRLPLLGETIPVADELINRADLTETDEELPNPNTLLDPLIYNKPLLIEGHLLTSDDPRALMQLELFVNNWLIRTAEIISSEIISISSEWPEIRSYLLNKKFMSTRELEKLRNQLNSQYQWQSLVKRPIQLYESKRLLYTFNENKIQTIIISETRDDELRNLGWSQQQIALLIEARDAIAPQLQALVKYIGDLMVVLLTKVIGRAIGLVGKGIAQGMGRSITKG